MKISSKRCFSPTVKSREQQFWDNLPPPNTCYNSHVTCHLSHVTCYLSCVMCHVSCVTCHMSCVTCHNYYFLFCFMFKKNTCDRWQVTPDMWHLIFFFIFILKLLPGPQLFGPPSLMVEGLLSTGPTPPRCYLFVDMGITITSFYSIKVVRTRLALYKKKPPWIFEMN